VEDPHLLVLQVQAPEVVKVVRQEQCNAVASVAALMGQKTAIATVTAPLDLLPAVNVVKASQECVLQLAADSVQLEWLLFVPAVEVGLRQGVVPEATVPQEVVDLEATGPQEVVDLEATGPQEVVDLEATGPQEVVDLEATVPQEVVDLEATGPQVAAVQVETDPQVGADLVATDLLVEEVVREAIARLVVAVDLVETVPLVVDLQEGCLLQCLVEQMG